ncbi:MAG: MmcQ/YjbR family DNA-binding protein [Bacteroidales bacterium]|nr:MmcQ/YjbR family DNA-binding protein [Bacteroidales bacterium]
MNIEKFREYCLSLPKVTEDFPFDEDLLVFRIHNKIFSAISMEKNNMAVMKCDPEKALDLREHYSAIEGAFHWNKKYWNQVHFNQDVSDTMIFELVSHSYNEVFNKLPKKLRDE